MDNPIKWKSNNLYRRSQKWKMSTTMIKFNKPQSSSRNWINSNTNNIFLRWSKTPRRWSIELRLKTIPMINNKSSLFSLWKTQSQHTWYSLWSGKSTIQRRSLTWLIWANCGKTLSHIKNDSLRTNIAGKNKSNSCIN